MANEVPKPASVSTGDAKSADNTPPKTSPATQPATTPEQAPTASQPEQDKPKPKPDPVTPMSREQKLEALLRKEFVRVEELVGSYYTHIGKCIKCGFQTMQNDAVAAEQLVLKHTFKHAKDVLSKL